jgi:protein SCO1/2
MTTTPTSTPTPPPARRLWLWGLLALLAVLIGIGVWSVVSGRLPFGAPNFHGMVMQSPDPVPDFTLTSQTGEELSLSDLRGKAVLLYFGYTYCPDACPTTLAELKKAKAELGAAGEDVQVVMVSVDPLRDTPEALAAYLAAFDPTFIGLTGSEEAILQAATPLGIYFAKNEGSAATGYLVDHTTTVAAIDRDGYLRVVYPFETQGEDIAADMRYLLR